MAIVEGHSEVESIPVIMRRFRDESASYEMRIARPIRVSRYKIVRQGELERTIDLIKTRYPEVRAIVLILDADDDCPKELAPQLLARARQVAGEDVICSVVLPMRELEAWFLATIESLTSVRGIVGEAVPTEDPEAIRDCKTRLTQAMSGHTYVETDDQPALAARFDMNEAYRRCRSFRKFQNDFERIVSSLASSG